MQIPENSQNRCATAYESPLMITKFVNLTRVECDTPHDINNFSKFGICFIAVKVSIDFPSPEGLVMDGTKKLPPGAFVAASCMPSLKKVNLCEG